MSSEPLPPYALEVSREYASSFSPEEFNALPTRDLLRKERFSAGAYTSRSRYACVPCTVAEWLDANVSAWDWRFLTRLYHRYSPRQGRYVDASLVSVVLIFPQEVDRLAFVMKFGEPQLTPVEAFGGGLLS